MRRLTDQHRAPKSTTRESPFPSPGRPRDCKYDNDQIREDFLRDIRHSLFLQIFPFFCRFESFAQSLPGCQRQVRRTRRNDAMSAWWCHAFVQQRASGIPTVTSRASQNHSKNANLGRSCATFDYANKGNH